MTEKSGRALFAVWLVGTATPFWPTPLMTIIFWGSCAWLLSRISD